MSKNKKEITFDFSDYFSEKKVYKLNISNQDPIQNSINKLIKPNPPKKKEKKIANPDLDFFDEQGIRKNDNKITNVFHDEYDTYQGYYKQPKVVSEKLRFFGKNII